MTPKQRIIAGTCEIKRISTLPSATKAMFDAELVAGTMLVPTTSFRVQTECHFRSFGSHSTRSQPTGGSNTGPPASTSTSLSG